MWSNFGCHKGANNSRGCRVCLGVPVSLRTGARRKHLTVMQTHLLRASLKAKAQVHGTRKCWPSPLLRPAAGPPISNPLPPAFSSSVCRSLAGFERHRIWLLAACLRHSTLGCSSECSKNHRVCVHLAKNILFTFRIIYKNNLEGF